MQHHAINKQVFEFTCSNELIAKSVRNEFVHYTAAQISELIADILSVHVQENSLVTIQELEIDLGDVEAGAFGNEEMLNKFRTILTEKISGIRNANNTAATAGGMSVSTADINLELTKSFMLHGDIPWWADKDIIPDADNIMQRLLHTNLQTIRLFLESQQGNANARLRIATQYKPSTKAMLYSLVPGLRTDFITSLAEEYPYGIPSSLLNVLSAEETAKLFSVLGRSATAVTAEKKTFLISRLIRNSNGQKLKSITRFNLFSADEMEMITALAKAGDQAKKHAGKKLNRIVRKLSIAQLEFLYHYMSEGYELDVQREQHLLGRTAENVYPAADNDIKSEDMAALHQVPVTAQVQAEKRISTEGRSLSHTAGKAATGQYADRQADPHTYERDSSHESMEASPENIITDGQQPVSRDRVKTQRQSNSAALTEHFITNDHQQASPDKAETDRQVDTAAAHEWFTTGDQQSVSPGKAEAQWQIESTAFPGTTDAGKGQSGVPAAAHTDKIAGLSHQPEEQTGSPARSTTAPAVNTEIITGTMPPDLKDDAVRRDDGFPGSDPADFIPAANNDIINTDTAIPDVKHNTIEEKNDVPLRSHPATSQPAVTATEPAADPVAYISRTSVSEAIHTGSVHADQFTSAAGLNTAAITAENAGVAPGNLPVAGALLPGLAEDIKQSNQDGSGRNQADELPVATVSGSSENKEARKRNRQIAFIMKGMHSSNPALHGYLQKLSAKELHELTRNFRHHTQKSTGHRKEVNNLLNHPYLLEYNLIQVFATLSFSEINSEKFLSDNRCSNLSRKQKTALDGCIKNSAAAQSLFVTVLKTLSLKETIVLQDIFQKKAFNSRSEKNLVRKILLYAPEKALLLMHFLTSLSEPALSQLQPPETQAAVTGAWLSEEKRPVDHEDDIKKFYVNNAGLCLIAPYLSGLFSQLGYIENRVFKNKITLTRALYVLQYLATGKLTSPEYMLQLNKVLCGVIPQQAVALQVKLTRKEIAEADALLESVVANWKVLKNTSVQGFREAFVQRKGILFRNGLSWTLQVEKKGHDMLLGTIPWGFNMIRLPWMKKMMQVEW